MILFGQGCPRTTSRGANAGSQALLVITAISRESEVRQWVMNNTQKP